MATRFNTSVFDAEAAERAAAALRQMESDPSAPLRAADIEPLFIEQLYDNYTDDDHAAWGSLFRTQWPHLEAHASALWLDGARAIGLNAEALPRLTEINARLKSLTGWQSRGVPGYISARPFFACIANRTFPTTVVIRPGSSLAYLPEPDIFHDVFGHVPLHAEPAFASFLAEWGRASLGANAADTERLARLFWFTVEFGLIQERGETRVYGAGLISSPSESRHCLTSPTVDRRPFDWREVIETPFEIDHEQPILFVLDSFDQLMRSMRECATALRGDCGACVTSPGARP